LRYFSMKSMARWLFAN